MAQTTPDNILNEGIVIIKNNTDFNDVNHFYETWKLLEEVRNELTQIHELDYRQMSEETYLN